MIKWDLFAETTDLDLEIVLLSIATNSDPWPKIFDQPGLKVLSLVLDHTFPEKCACDASTCHN